MKGLAYRRQGGLTLIELMVALAVFSVLGVLSFRALSAATSAQSHLDASFLRWNALDRSLGRVETELLEIVMPPDSSASTQMNTLQFGRTDDGVSSQLSFLRLDARYGVRRVGFRLREQRLEWLLWEGREAVGRPHVEVLLENVNDLRWQFINDGRRVDKWGPGDGSVSRLPAGMVLELDLPDLGTFQRVFALH